MASPSPKPTAVAAVLAVLVGVLSGAWWLLGGAGGSAAGPEPASSAAEEPEAVQPPAARGSGERKAAEEPPQDRARQPLATGPSSPQARVVVVVVDLDRRPVPAALVEITGDGPPGIHTADDAGICPLPLAPGRDKVDLRVTATGFVPGCLRTGRAERIEVVLRRSADVGGRVVTAGSGTPVAGAHVTLRSFGCGEPAPEAVTDATGRFDLRGLPLGQSIRWRVRAEGFATREQDMELRHPAVEVVLALDEGVPLELLVVDALTNAPIRRAAISHDGTVLLTDDSGRVETTALLAAEEEQALLGVRAPGYCELRAWIRAAALVPGTPVRLPLLEGARLEGSVLDPDGAPAAGVLVHLSFDATGRMRADESSQGARELVELPEQWSLQGPRFEDVVSDEAGRFGFEGLEPLSRWYRVRALGEVGWIADGQEVPPLGRPGSTTRIDIVLPAPDTGVVTGTLTLNGAPAQGSLGWQGPTRSGRGQTEGNGSFRLEGIEPGRITIRPQPEDLLGFARCRDLFAGPWAVDVPVDGEVRLDIALELETAVITGRVVDALGTPQAGLQVMALSRDGCWRDLVQSDDDGSFALSVRAGPWDYHVTAGRYPDGVGRVGVLAGTHDLELVLPGSGTLRLRVVDERTREPLSEFALFLEDERGRSLAPLYGRIDSAFSPDPEGWYETELPSGPWRLFVGDWPGGPVSGYLPVDHGEIRIGDTDAPYALEIPRARGAELLVRLAPGLEPWPDDVHVLVLEADRCEQVELGPSGWQIGQGFRGLNVVEARALRLDAGGQARARALHPGRCRFVAFPDTIAIEPAEVVVTGNESEPVAIRWTPR